MQLVDRLARVMGFERRAAASSPSWGNLGQMLGNGPAVNERMAENLSAVAACVGAISSALAMAPANIYRREGELRTEVFDHPARRLIMNGPNDHQTWPDLLESFIASALLSGNGLIEIERDGAEISRLKHIPWTWVSPLLAPSGRLVYDVTEQTGLYGATGRVRRLLAGDVVHLRDRSDDGILGRSRLSRSADTVNAALSAANYARSFMENGARPSGLLTTEGKISPEQMDQFQKAWDENMKARNGGTAIVTGGFKYPPLSVTPEDAELLSSRKFSVEEICRLYQVPPPLVQDYSHNTFTNSEAAGRWFAQFTLGPWARKVEAALSRALFTEGSGLELELDLSSFLRGDPQTRWAAHKIAVDAGILDADEVREIEGFNPRQAAPVVVA